MMHPTRGLSPTIRVVLADDHPSLREGIKARLRAEPDVAVVAEAATGPDALRAVLDLVPDVVLLDMDMPGMSGLEVARQLAAEQSPARILVLSAHHNEEYVARLLDYGAAGYLTKSEPLETIVAAIRGVAAGEEGWLSRSVAASLIKSRRSRVPDSDDPIGLLSEREREVLEYLARGHGNQEIAEVLSISESTVKKHVNNIYFKLELSSRAELVAWCWQHRIVTPDSG
jgi:DNA-binding NarL/FixJ family response regulator